MSDIWVIVRDLGYEGLGEPVAGYTAEGDASRQAEIFEKVSFCKMRVIKVPLFSVSDAEPESTVKQETCPFPSATGCSHDWATDGAGDYCRLCGKRE